jgi:hypothetical protein
MEDILRTGFKPVMASSLNSVDLFSFMFIFLMPIACLLSEYISKQLQLFSPTRAAYFLNYAKAWTGFHYWQPKPWQTVTVTFVTI